MPNITNIIDNVKLITKLYPMPSYIDLLHSDQTSLVTQYKLTKSEAKELVTKLKDYNELSKKDLSDTTYYKVFIALGIPSELSTYLVIDGVTIGTLTEKVLKEYTEYKPEMLMRIEANLQIYYSDPKYFISQATIIKSASKSYDDTNPNDTGQKSIRIRRITQ